MTTVKNYQQYNLCKEIFLKFAGQFAQGKLTDAAFFNYHKDLMRLDPQATNYAYQFALYSCYKRTNYDAKELLKAFDNKFKIKDVYNMNGHDCDISTLNTTFIVDFMVNKTPFKTLPITIFNAPLDFGTEHYKSIQNSPFVKPIVDRSRIQTGQSNNDLQIGDRLYDIKHTDKTSSVFNHIYPWTYEQLNTKGPMYLNNLHTRLEKYNNQFASKMAKDVENLKQNSNLTQMQKIEILNEYFNLKWLEIEKHDIIIPIIIPMTQTPFKPQMPKAYHEKLHLPPNIIENERETRNAVINSIDVRYKKKAIEILTNAKAMTDGILDSTPQEKPLDMPD